MWDVISKARGGDPDGNSVFRGSRIESALSSEGSSDDNRSPSPWSLTFELKDMPDEEETKSSVFSQEEFLGLTSQDIVGTVAMEANPVLIAVRLEKRVPEEEATSSKPSDA